MDFWDMSVDEALSGIPASTPIAEDTLLQFASTGSYDPLLSTLPQSEATAPRSPEEIDATAIDAVEPESKPKKKKKAGGKDDSTTDNAVSLKRAYFDVKKFAISGMEGTEKEEAKVRLAVSLGAKPKKKKNVNYKELKKERSEAKKAAEEDRSLKMRQGGILKKKKGKDSGKKSKLNKKSRRRK